MNIQLSDLLKEALSTMPLVAILRGIQPSEIEGVARVLVAEGFRFIEVPLNSPDAWESIRRLKALVPDNILVGAGTVVDVKASAELAELNAVLQITPNTDIEVIKAGKSAGLATFTGFMTPSEAFAGINAGTTALKLFPAQRLGCDYFKDIKTVLPRNTPILAVGGVNASNMAEWFDAGISGFGFGSNLYTPGRTAEEVRIVAAELVQTWTNLCNGDLSK
jgi:2-dehydro-3-deoxyphosphogalactonate aldolase